MVAATPATATTASAVLILISRPVIAAPAGVCSRAGRRRSARRDRLSPHAGAAVRSRRRSHGLRWKSDHRLGGLPCGSLLSQRRGSPFSVARGGARVWPGRQQPRQVVHAVAWRARSITPATVPTYISRVVR